MFTIKIEFGRAASCNSGVSTFWLLLFAIAILDDDERREKERCKKRQHAAAPPRKTKWPSGPRPF